MSRASKPYGLIQQGAQEGQEPGSGKSLCINNIKREMPTAQEEEIHHLDKEEKEGSAMSCVLPGEFLIQEPSLMPIKLNISSHWFN